MASHSSSLTSSSYRDRSISSFVDPEYFIARGGKDQVWVVWRNTH
jgi:hypothetical protein